jgi:replication factor C subunit 3/5
MQNMQNLPWIEKYRPTTLNEVLSHEEIIGTLKTFIKNKCLPHLLFYGNPGTGKSSIIAAVARELYGKYYPSMVMELNASDDRGIEVVRNKIKQFVISKSAFMYQNTDAALNSNFKLVILDEADAMTSDAQNILRKIVEKYTNNTRFCLICNYIQNINPALKSRCTIFRFSPIGDDKIKEKILQISIKENINIQESGIDTIVKRSNGDMRKVINILQSVSMSYPFINEENVNTSLGYPSFKNIMTILKYLMVDNFEVAYDGIMEIYTQNGFSLDDIITEIHEIFLSYLINSKSEIAFINKVDKERIMKILDKLRTIEFNQSVNIIDNIQISGLIGVFHF